MMKGKIVSKTEFLRDGLWSKEQYEGLLVSADRSTGLYNIGVQLSENQVLVVDQTKADSIRERIQGWAPQIYDIQRQHGVDIDQGNYTK
ncbi:MAG: hypothetical protein ACM3PE_11885 [Deltaproteobacteria bacterium]